MKAKARPVRLGPVHAEGVIYERSKPNRKGVETSEAPNWFKPDIPDRFLRYEAAKLPEVTENNAVRHFVRLSRQNYGVDVGFYPLGSCTMKYNPKVNEAAATLPGFTDLHPMSDPELAQGALQLMYELADYLAKIGGFEAVSLLPAAGAHGEYTGLRIIRAALEKRGEKRKKVLIPDTAHGTNPASSVLNGYKAVEIKSGPDGILTPEAVAKVMDEDTAALMITNPNTLGLFESNLPEIAKIVHEKGGYVYGDGANLNAIMGIVRPADLGIDVMHFNLHKTFSTPHGGGGPGSGPVGVVKELEPFLPVPRVVKDGDKYLLKEDFPDTIGRVIGFNGHFLVMVRAYTYIRMMGPEGLKKVSELAVLNANYLRVLLQYDYNLPYQRICKHEVVFNDKFQRGQDITTMDIAKRLLDYGIHAPTVFFPLIVKHAIMIEPTETESKETLDEFVEVMKEIAKEAKERPEVVKNAPTRTFIGRPDEVTAARHPVLVYPVD